MNLDLSGRTAVVTGAGQGLGFGFAKALAASGAKVLITDINPDVVTAAAERLDPSAVQVRSLIGDNGDADFADEMVGAALEAFGSIDILLNNAGFVRPAMLWNMTNEDWDAVLRVHLSGTFYGLRAAARVMREAGYGRIINITSAGGIDGTIGQINYSAAKAGIVGITKAAARELATSGVTVNAIAPVAATPMTQTVRTREDLVAKILPTIPMQRYADPDEVAPAVVYLASEASGYTTGHVMLVDGGMSM